MTYSITRYGKPLDKILYTIDKKTEIFSSNESGLDIDFSDEPGWTFRTSANCIFRTSSICTFITGSDCTFNTGRYCTFKTGSHCTFKTSSDCTFNTSSHCTFNIQSDCILLNRYSSKRYFLDDIYRYILHNDGLLELKNKNDALLNVRHDNYYVREVCNKLIKEK